MDNEPRIKVVVEGLVRHDLLLRREELGAHVARVGEEGALAQDIGVAPAEELDDRTLLARAVELVPALRGHGRRVPCKVDRFHLEHRAVRALDRHEEGVVGLGVEAHAVARGLLLAEHVSKVGVVAVGGVDGHCRAGEVGVVDDVGVADEAVVVLERLLPTLGAASRREPAGLLERGIGGDDVTCWRGRAGRGGGVRRLENSIKEYGKRRARSVPGGPGRSWIIGAQEDGRRAGAGGRVSRIGRGGAVRDPPETGMGARRTCAGMGGVD